MIEFGTNADWRYHLAAEEVRFTVRQDGTTILCRVPRKVIEGHLNVPQAAEACLTVAKERFDELTDIVQRIIADKRFEADGSLLLRRADWR